MTSGLRALLFMLMVPAAGVMAGVAIAQDDGGADTPAAGAADAPAPDAPAAESADGPPPAETGLESADGPPPAETALESVDGPPPTETDPETADGPPPTDPSELPESDVSDDPAGAVDSVEPGESPVDPDEPSSDTGAVQPSVRFDPEIDPGACTTCHTDQGVAGHFPPAVQGCLGCHVEVGEPAEDVERTDHIAFVLASDATCAGCHEPETPTFGHAPVESGMCLACHNPHDTTKKSSHLREKTEADVCDDCHERKDGGVYPHTVVALGRCSACHIAHGAEQTYLLKGDFTNAACKDCHQKQHVDNEFDHWPAASEQCDLCHDPHGSENKFSLHLPDKQICYQCHPPKEDRRQVHSAVKLGRCSRCHNPHGSENDRKLRGDPVSEVCFGCHYDDIDGRKVVHAPVAAGNCTMCHDPHQTEFPKNLRAEVNVTCGMCHPDKYRPDVKTPHPAVMTYGCTVCHDPHASDYDFRLRKPIIELCTTCHRGYDDGYHVVQRPAGGGHPVGKHDDPLREGRELTCTSCHDPHGTENPRMWYRAYQRLALCVECHRSTLAPTSETGSSTFEQEADAQRATEVQTPRETP